MIISDPHHFAFIHIPKCAGSAVRRQLLPFDSYEGGFSGRQVHSHLGLVDYQHISLKTLHDHFALEFNKVRAYHSFAIVRDPFARFISGIFQHMAEFQGASHQDITLPNALKVVSSVIGRLQQDETKYDFQMAYFQKQVDFVELNGSRIVTNLFTTNNMASFSNVLREKCRLQFDPKKRDNDRQVADSLLIRNVKRLIGPVYQAAFSGSVRAHIRRAMWVTGLNNSAELFYEKIRRQSSVWDFVREYYADDVALYASVSSSDSQEPKRRGDAEQIRHSSDSAGKSRYA